MAKKGVANFSNQVAKQLIKEQKKKMKELEKQQKEQYINDRYEEASILTNNIDIYIKKDYKDIKDTIDIFKLLMLDKLFSLNNIILLHSSYIKYKNNAILFSAPSGTGKSTQANLWNKYENAEIINGDKTAIQKVNRIWYAYGLPYAGSSDIFKNISTPISAIVVLRKGSKNKVEKLTLKEAFKHIYSETIINIWDEQFVNMVVDMILDIIDNIPVYLLSCLPNQDAVELLKSKIEGDF